MLDLTGAKPPKASESNTGDEGKLAAAGDAGQEGAVVSYASKARISLIDEENRAMAHGIILDDEPAIPDSGEEISVPWTSAHEGLADCSHKSFKLVKLSGVVRYVSAFLSAFTMHL